MDIKSTASLTYLQIRKNLLRSILTVLGIIVGIAAMITVLSVGEAGQYKIYKELEKFGINRVFIFPEKTSTRSISTADYDMLVERFPDTLVCPVIIKKSKIKYRNKTILADISATTPTIAEVEIIELLEGRFIDSRDLQYQKRVIVISEETRNELFGSLACVGQSVNVSGEKYTVVGVEKKVDSIASGFITSKNYIPLTTGVYQFGSKSLSEISISTTSPEELEEVSKRSVELLLKKHGTGSIKVMNLSKEIENASAIMNTFELVIAAVALLSLLVGGIGIMNIMLVNVRERRREIGIRKALGATEEKIMLQFLTEGTFYAVIGSVLGIIFGVGLTLLASSIIDLSGKVSITSVVLSVVFSVAVGLVFSLLPAKKAAKLDPAEALRS